MSIHIEVWLYGPVARYVKGGSGSHARLELVMSDASTLSDLIQRLGIPNEERGLIFINGKLTAMPGLEPDPSPSLRDGDRVGIFHRRSMWPFQYRFGAQMTPELERVVRRQTNGGIHHAYTSDKRGVPLDSKGNLE